MKMIIKVLSKKNFIKFMENGHQGDIAVISIRNIEDDGFSIRHNNFNGIQYAIKIVFNDVECNEVGCMSKEDAHKISNFVNTIKNKVNMIVVHCEAGISRSAGVAAAIMKYLNNDDSEIFNNPAFCPNMHCYRLVLNSLMNNDEYSDIYSSEINKKEKHNIQLWKRAQDLI